MSVAGDVPAVQPGVLYVPPEGHTQFEHAVAPVVAVYVPAAQGVQVSGVAAVHVSATAVFPHVYVEDAALPAYPGLHVHVIWYGCPLDKAVAPLCTAFAGAPMA